MLIGNPGSQPMYLAVTLCMRPEFEETVRLGCLSTVHFVMIECRYNDPEVSFFAGVPDGEATVPVAGKPAFSSTSPNPAICPCTCSTSASTAST